MSGIWNMSIWNVILHKKEGTGLIFSTVPFFFPPGATFGPAVLPRPPSWLRVVFSLRFSVYLPWFFAFLLWWRLHILVIPPHLWKKVCLQRKYYVYMTLTQLALSASMFHAFWLVNPYKIQRDRPSFSTNPRLRTNSPACAETCALDSYTVRKWHRPNLLNCTKNTENFGFYRHDNFFY